MVPKLSIIIPVYNVAKTLNRSLQSIKISRPKDVEVIIIDDGSADRTPDLLDDYKHHVSLSCRIIRQDNAGVAAARNRGLQESSGDYLVFLDADDQWEPGALDRILALANEGADIVGWDFISAGYEYCRMIQQADYTSPEDALRNLMGGTMKWNLWLFAIKKKLLTNNGILFIPGADIGEDMGFMLKAFAVSRSVKQVHEALYRYNVANSESISLRKDNGRWKEIMHNLSSVESFMKDSRYSGLFDSLLPHLKLYIKLPLLISTDIKQYKYWYSLFPEANRFSMKNMDLPFRTRLLQGMASHRIWMGVWLYNVIVYRVIYRILY